MGKKYTDFGLGRIYSCPICSKNFIPRAGLNWLYKIQRVYYCSYNCWRKAGGDNGKRNHGM